MLSTVIALRAILADFIENGIVSPNYLTINGPVNGHTRVTFQYLSTSWIWKISDRFKVATQVNAVPGTDNKSVFSTELAYGKVRVYAYTIIDRD